MAAVSPENRAVTGQKTGSAGVWWLVQALTGALLIAVLTLHMVAHHFVVEGGLRTYQQVLAYVANPLIFAVEIAFVVVATVHAMLGVRAILFDLGPGPRLRDTINFGLGLLGVVTISYGLWLALAFQALAR